MNKVTLISGYYYPEDTAIGLYNTQMVEWLEIKGYKVTVITGFPSYPQWRIRDEYRDKKTFLLEGHNKTKIYRYKQYVPSTPTFLTRILLLLDFTFGSFVNVLKIKECDVVISIVPHTSTLLLGWILKNRSKAILWNHIQDFEFDAANETGISTNKRGIKKVVFNALFKVETWLLNKGDINSTISYKMLDKLKSKSKSKTFYFPNWINYKNIDPSIGGKHDYLPEASFNILYSGNIGDKQDWEFFLQFAEKLTSYNVNIIVVGDGSKREWLIGKVNSLKNVKYYPPVPYSELSSLLCSADLHVLFQKNDVVDSVMPSKLLGMMASAKPSLITGNMDSEVKVVINESKGGFYISDADVEKCISIVKELINSPEKVSTTGLNARAYVVNKFSSEKVLASFENKLSETINK
ncbi:WcaI family glycosyltransferase [Algibacter mikhailovii]|uniref:WcaI family glycosyltransferase n=1 Tax=Algibacter mikhailovii TaxID=425498 RepID=UPI002493FE2C|nr:WcaI family glycosyltransferase [Algibacter mikhailovii]